MAKLDDSEKSVDSANVVKLKEKLLKISKKKLSLCSQENTMVYNCHFSPYHEQGVIFI